MPINTINYAMIPAQGDPLLEAIGPGLMQGLKLAYAPKQMQQQEVSALPADPAVRAAQLQPLVNVATLKLAKFVAPNWNVKPEEAQPVAESVALVLAYWMPDTTLDPKYLALLQLGASIYALAETRRDPETGEYIQLRVKPVKIDEQQNQQQQEMKL